MKNLTNNEINLLKVIKNGFLLAEEHIPEFQLCNSDIVKALPKIGMDMNTAKGVISSLIKKNVVELYIDSKDAEDNGYAKDYSVFMLSIC
jgi:hypothetical protein